MNVVPVARHGVLDSLKRMFSIPALAGVGALLILLFVALWMIKPDGGFQISVDSVVPGDTSPGSSDVAESPLPNTEPDNDPHVAARGNSEQSRRKPKQPEVEVASSGQADQPPANAEPQPGQLQAVQPPVNGVQPPPQQFAKHDEPPQSPIPEIPDVMKPLPPSPDTGGERAEYVTLSSASRSATKSNTASISAATRSLVVRLLFSGEAYTSYAVRVSTLGGGTVWWMSRLKASMKDGARSLSVTIPASALSRKDYIVVLEGLSKEGRLETIREYYLRVDRH